jgi:phage terminase large subunit
MLRNAKGESKLFIHPHCKELIKGLDGMTYKKDTNLPDKSLGLDHITDALGYLVCYEFPINAPMSAPLSWGRR